MTAPRLTELATLEAVGLILSRELRTRDARLKALEDRPIEAPLKGDKGDKGDKGEQGDKGDRGEAIKGDAGDKGDKGDRGLQGDSVKGDKGDRGDEGKHGRDGAGIDSPAWAAGVHREGVVVQHHIGQFFRALKDTASEPPGDDWQRVGSMGFRLMSGHVEGRSYRDGDLFVRDFGLFLWKDSEAHLLAGRGGRGDKGDKGDRGKDAEPAKAGRDGAVIEAIELREARMALVQRTPDGVQEVIADLMPLIDATIEAVQHRLDVTEERMEARFEERLAKALEGRVVIEAKPRNGHSRGTP